MAQLRKELREAREERDILKRAVAFMPMARLCRKRWAGEAVAAGQRWWARLGVSA